MIVYVTYITNTGVELAHASTQSVDAIERVLIGSAKLRAVQAPNTSNPPLSTFDLTTLALTFAGQEIN